MHQAVVVGLLIGIVVLTIINMAWRGLRSDSLMSQWAQANGLTLLSEERRTFFKGPFFWSSGKGQMIYYVTVQDSNGRVRHAWVRCGGYFLGMLSDNFEVKWDD